MALLLQIDTAPEHAFVGISQNGRMLMELSNASPNNHAAFVQPAIHEIADNLGIKLRDIDAVGVTSGPGSYTGLRVGMASAKGICYALGKPLIAVSTLQLMAAAAVASYPDFDLYAPMIDARRNEVFTALYNSSGAIVSVPEAVILSEELFAVYAESKTIICFGNGAPKWKQSAGEKRNISFEHISYKSLHLAGLLQKAYRSGNFCDLAYCEPFYIKDYYFASGSK